MEGVLNHEILEYEEPENEDSAPSLFNAVNAECILRDRGDYDEFCLTHNQDASLCHLLGELF